MFKKQFILSALSNGKVRLEGQFVYGSNFTFLIECGYQGDIIKAVYKPTRGERPLWDFPQQTLAKREVIAFLLSDFLAWDLVAPTVFREGDLPMGPGSVQYFVEHDPEVHYFTLDEKYREQLPAVILFDLLINNADRKAGHLIIDDEGKLWLIDHGLSFHVENKLRTVIWDFADQPIPQQLLGDVKKLTQKLTPIDPFYQSLTLYLSPEEVAALLERAYMLINHGKFPLPPEDRRAYPWPLI
jgi:uncharacterized repeat protein (TIGR03843 family)